MKTFYGMVTLVSAACFGLVGCEDKNEPASPMSPPSPGEISPAEPQNRPLGVTDDEMRNIDRTPGAINEPTAREQMAGNSSAINQITAARCAREQTCKNIGPDKKYSTMTACETEIGKEWKEDLSKLECPNGIVEKELSECLKEIRDEDCNNPFDTLGRVAACRESDLCNAT